MSQKRITSFFKRKEEAAEDHSSEPICTTKSEPGDASGMLESASEYTSDPRSVAECDMPICPTKSEPGDVSGMLEAEAVVQPKVEKIISRKRNGSAQSDESSPHKKQKSDKDDSGVKTKKSEHKSGPLTPMPSKPEPSKSEPLKSRSLKCAGSDDTSGTAYNPAAQKYDPVNSAFWKRSERVPYIALAKTFDAIEQVSSRLKIIDILANYFRSVIVLSPNDLLPSIYLCLNQLAPAFENVELGIAENILIRSIAESTGRSLGHIKTDLTARGDLGTVAEESRKKQHTMFKKAKLTVPGVFEKLLEIAKMSGKSVIKSKISKVINLFVACSSLEARYLIRSLSGKLRIGLAEQSVLQALAVACTKTPPLQEYPPAIVDSSSQGQESYKKQLEKNSILIKTAYCECPDYGRIVPSLLEFEIDALPMKCHLTAGVPLKPMLAHPTRGIQEIFERFEGSLFTCEYKYDGERAQIHLTDKGDLSIFSRNQENNTTKYPDIISIMKKVVDSSVTSYILDCEAVAWDPQLKKILPFQILSTRKRKNAEESEITVGVCVYAFDLLLLNGQSLVKEPLLKRRALLKQTFTPTEGEFQFAQSMDTNIFDEVQSFLEEAIKGSCEGLMVKTLEEEATYEIARRSHKWLKLKKDYLDGIGDTIDVVVIGGYKGQGKRAGTYGGFLLAIYDENQEEFQTLCKIGTGFSDEDLIQHTNYFKEHIIPEAKPYYRYDKSHMPDDWFDAVQVWEIKGADLTFSPTHWAAKGLCSGDPRGISLRFPRFLKIRNDKSVTDATTAQQVAEMFLNQAQMQSLAGTGATVMEEDFY